MYKEIKIIEQHFADKEGYVVTECVNTTGKKGSEELKDIEKEYKYLISKKVLTYPCKTYNAVTMVVTVYLFSKQKTEKSIVEI